MMAQPDALRLAAIAHGCTFRLEACRHDGRDGEALTMTAASGTATLEVPRDWELLDFRHALPGRGRGDQREKLLSAAVQDAAEVPPAREDRELRSNLEHHIPTATTPLARRVLADVLGEQYWIRPRATGGRQASPFAFPFHSAVPLNYTHPGQYKMFRGDILLFLSWTGEDFDRDLIERLLGLLNSRDDLTLMDRILLDAVADACGDGAPEQADAAALLQGKQAQKVRAGLEPGPFDQQALDGFRSDLRCVLDTPLPRHDRIAAVMLTLSLHLGLYYYRLAFALGRGIEQCIAAASGDAARKLPWQDEFRGRIAFRVGTAGDRPLSASDPCARAWRELDDRYLLALSANIVTSNLLATCWLAVDPATSPPAPDPGALARRMASDSAFARTIDAMAGGLAAIYADRAVQLTAEDTEAIARLRPGIYGLHEAVLADRRSRNRLKHHSRDVVNQLVRRPFGGSLISTRGNVRYFELDEEFLYLLVKFVLGRRHSNQIPYRDFLSELAGYGLQPQDPQEVEVLASALERLGMLERYSDAGEAQYVRHLL